MFPKSQLDLYLDSTENENEDDIEPESESKSQTFSETAIDSNTITYSITNLLIRHKDILLYLISSMKSMKYILINVFVTLSISLYKPLLIYTNQLEVIYHYETNINQSVFILFLMEFICIYIINSIIYYYYIFKIYFSICIGISNSSSNELNTMVSSAGIFASYYSYLWWYSTIQLLLFLIFCIAIQVVLYKYILYNTNNLIHMLHKNECNTQVAIQSIKRMQYYCMGKEVFHPNPPSIHTLDTTIQCLNLQKQTLHIEKLCGSSKNQANVLDINMNSDINNMY